jgi:SAM-dependent methyltransferase
MKPSGKNFYKGRKEHLRKMYWAEKPCGPANANGFKAYPRKIYDQFAALIKGPGKVLDLGCGNGLLLKHLVGKAESRLVPFGIDFIEEAIAQAKKTILPKFRKNFKVCNIADFDFAGAPFEYIIFDPYSIRPNDWSPLFKKLRRSLSATGRIIFAAYKDVLEYFGIDWVGAFPFLSRLNLDRVDGQGVSFALYRPARSKCNARRRLR